MFVECETPAETMATEEMLVESSVKSTSIHSGGWVGFKPSDYGAVGVSMHYHCVYRPSATTLHFSCLQVMEH